MSCSERSKRLVEERAETMTDTPTPAPASEADVQDFADMSAALTGFLSSVLKPQLDPVGLARTYYEFALVQVQAPQMKALLDAFRAIRTQPPQTIADTLLETAAPDSTKLSQTAYLAQSIVAMWYLGSWYPPGVRGGVDSRRWRSRSFRRSP